MDMIKDARQEAIKVLIQNATEHGLMASNLNETSSSRHYNSIFARDISISMMGVLFSGDDDLIAQAKQGLGIIARYQAKNGQMPNFVDAEAGTADFWYVGCIDATLWWLLAIDFHDRHTRGKDNLRKKYKRNIERAIAWLGCQEHQSFHLLSQNEASDWADIMPRSGFVLYSNVLWTMVKERYGLEGLADTKENLSYVFFPWQKIPKERTRANCRLKVLTEYALEKICPKEYYLSFVNYFSVGQDVDVFTHMLMILSGVTSARFNKSLVRFLVENKANKPYPVRSILFPIEADSKLWRDYMLRHNLNQAGQYHNGGVWPFLGAWWVIALNHCGFNNLAQSEMAALAKANSLNHWQFNEWINSNNGQPSGMSGQTWNAAMYLLAYQDLFIEKIKL